MVKFGTSGWRGIIAEDFTFNNVRVAVQGIANYVLENNGKEIVIGYDTRFLSEDFARVASEILIGNGIKVSLSRIDVPTPTVAFETVNRKAFGAINFTASHNDYIYNGLKFSSPSGGPALPEETNRIEKLIQKIELKDVKYSGRDVLYDVQYYDGSEYLKSLSLLVDFEPIKKAKKKVVYEAFYGTGRNYVPALLSNYTQFKMINGYRDPLFGKKHPEPIEKNLKELSLSVLEFNADIGISTDGDADRFGFIDKSGDYISPNIVLPIIYKYLIEYRGLRGNVSRTISTTTMLDRIAKKYGFEVVETPVGFKYIGETIIKGECIFGGEESGGASMIGWLAEKDGILMNALVVEIVSNTNRTLRELYNEIEAEFGEIYSKRLDFDFFGNRELTENTLKRNAAELQKKSRISRIVDLDGLKLFLDESDWILFRFSGTEPKARIYLEGTSKEKLEELETFSKILFLSSQGDNDKI